MPTSSYYNYTAYRKFINEIVPYIKDTNTVRMWGGLTWINDHKTEITKDAIENVEMNLCPRTGPTASRCTTWATS